MKASEAGLLDFIKKSPQFVIPIYQRTYSWTEKECRQFWDDVLRAGSHVAINVHFVGSVVYVESGLSQVTQFSPLLVIDGQQRLTTVTLLISALAEVLGAAEPVDGFSSRKLRNYYLVNPEEDGERRFKLLLSQTDRDSLLSIVGGNKQSTEGSLRIAQAYKLFQKLLESCNGDFADLCRGLSKLVVVDIALSREHDNPQLIFESMNSTGRQLSQADLIRNYILMGLETEMQERLYEQFWHPMELEFGQEAYSSDFDGFMRHYLTVKTGEIPKVGDVYEAFKDHATQPTVADAGIDALVQDVREFARYFCAMALGPECEGDLRLAFHDLRELRVDVAYPFLLELYQHYANGDLAAADLLAAVRLVESYVFRRAICAIPTNSLNKTFATAGKMLLKERYVESIEAYFLLLPSYRRFPDDDEFQRNLRSRDLYNFRSRSYWLRRTENHNRKERVPVDEYTIEHILPQNPDLVAEWREALGSEWQRVQEEWLHTLGNLTLTGYNSEYSDRPFPEKRDMEGGFKSSPLKLNEGLGSVERWDEAAIQARATRLAKTALDVWQAPALTAEVLDEYRPKPDAKVTYTLDDHRHLLGDAQRSLYNALRTEVLALDPCVSEEVLKLYIAFKAETNFVDVVPQATRLVLSLNISLPELEDPRGLCKDVSQFGHWGNGDVELALESADQLSYTIGLIRQALERQMGNGGDV
jgi:uncharacterized protein with ParB-like and HNH nuclease domain/predicted transport protein